jgi:predicted MarR family transcription regulator
VKTGHKEEAIRKIQHWDLLTRKLQVGVFIRSGRMDSEVTQVTEDLRERLEDLRDALLADNLTEAREELLPKVEEAYRRCRSVYETAKDSMGQMSGAGHESH